MGKKFMNLCIVSIVSGNYLAYVKVLAESVKQHMPDADFRVLIVDRHSKVIDLELNKSGLNAIYATDLGLPDFERIAYKYDILELNTALKPTFIKHMFAEGFSHVIYLDPDIKLFAPLTPIIEALAEAEIALIPHAFKPVMDGERPSDLDFLRSGAYNLGFIGLRQGVESLRMLDWWEDRCLGLGFNDNASGMFVDQKWIDLVPCYFTSVKIIRHQGCNVAYWNLHEREIARSNNEFIVNGEKLIFFHFSGIDAKKPNSLSKYQTRHLLKLGSPLAEIIAAYCQALLNAGHMDMLNIPYSFARLDDGTPITPLMRRALLVFRGNELTPFVSASHFQKRLKECHLTPRSKDITRPENITSLNLDQNGIRFKAVNMAIKVLARSLGINILNQLLRYSSFLTRGGNLSAILINEKLDLRPLSKR
jgi:hypothetical protein